ncbi:MAG: hypothetical protein HRU75_01890 [Planctomycetia bacterium]|nr:MAG: hypothetical protein HRU75_01890 [Planctomycetia bacterium]
MTRHWTDAVPAERFSRGHVVVLCVAAALLVASGVLFLSEAPRSGGSAIDPPTPAAVHPPVHPVAPDRAAQPVATSAQGPSGQDQDAQHPSAEFEGNLPAPVAAQEPAPPAASLPAAQVTWPTSDRWLHFSAGATPGPLKWSGPRTDAILAPPIIWAAQASAEEGGAAGQERLLRFIRQRNPGARIGRYFSCCTIRPRPLYHPPESVPAEALDGMLMNASWSPQEPGRRYIDIRREDVRRRLAGLLVSGARRENFLALDNFIFEFGGNPDGTTRQEWSDANYALLSEIYAQARRAALPVVLNAATRPEETWARVTAHCDGILFEMPFHPNMRRDPALLEREMAAYRAALDAGKLVCLIPITPANHTLAQKLEEQRLVAAGAMLVREAGDAIFVAQTLYQPTPADWMEWPARLGPAQGRYRVEGREMTREFERGVLRVDWAAGRVTLGSRAAVREGG